MGFSIVIPVYNVVSYLPECLDSVLGQSFTSWEAVCVDDGSTDGSSSLLDKYAEKDPRIRVIHVSNGGVSNARNIGLDASRGEYVVFLDADDMLTPSTLATLDDCVSESSCDIYTFDIERFESLLSFKKRIPVDLKRPHRVSVYDLTTSCDAKTAFERMVGSLLAWNGCYRREFLAGIRFERFVNGEDLLFGTLAFCQANTIASIDEKLYLYRVGREGSAVFSSSLKKVESISDVVERWCQVISQWPYAKYVKDAYSRKLRSFVLGELYGFVCGIELREDRLKARSIFMALIQKLAISHASCCFAAFGRFRVCILRNIQIWPLVVLLERVPFYIRVMLLRFPLVVRVKAMIRKGR